MTIRYIICLAGLPREVVDEIGKRPGKRFTEDRDRGPIVRPIKEPYVFRPGMSDAYLSAIASELEAIKPSQDVGIGVAYVGYGETARSFAEKFFPFATTARLDPFYPNAAEKAARRQRLVSYVDELESAVDAMRRRISAVRDALSGQHFSPLTLPLHNFASGVLQETIKTLFEELGSDIDPRDRLKTAVDAISKSHPLRRFEDRNKRPYFEDDTGLRFRSPGQEKHAVARRQGDGHSQHCLINARARLGGPIDMGFHYDCDYEKRNVNDQYSNCHRENTAPSNRTYVNIAPNDYIR